MESPNRENGDAVKAPPPPLEELHKRVAALEKMRDNFRIIGEGVSGDLHKGFSISFPD